jgi:hypothetical protein
MVIFYALLNRRRGVNERSSANTPADITYAAAGVIAGDCLLTFLATAGHALLPPIINIHGYANAMLAVNAAAWLFSLVALVVLGSRRPYPLLDLWLMVVLCAWAFDVGLGRVINGGGFDVAYYAGRLYGRFAVSAL